MNDDTNMIDSAVEVMPSGNAIELMQRAEVDIQISTAKKYPRQNAVVKQKMMGFATLDQETAESCFYSLPRGGKTIQGPSVRLAEIAASCYGNLRVSTRIMSEVIDGPSPHVVVVAMASDLENNVAIAMEKRRRITSKKNQDGTRQPVSEDDINLAVNACTAIAFRDAVFKVVPGALVKPVFEQAKLTATGDAKTLSDKRMLAIEFFAKMGISKERVLAHLAKASVDDVDLQDLEALLGLKTAIKDGQISIDEAFPDPKSGKTTTSGPSSTAKPEPPAPKEKTQKPKTEPPAQAATTEQPAKKQEPPKDPPKEAAKEPEPKKEPKKEKPPEEKVVQMPKPAPATPPTPPAPEPEPEGATGKAEPASLESKLAAGNVNLDGFKRWYKMRMGPAGKDVSTWNTWADVPADVIGPIEADPKTVAKIIMTMGD